MNFLVHFVFQEIATYQVTKTQRTVPNMQRCFHIFSRIGFNSAHSDHNIYKVHEM